MRYHVTDDDDQRLMLESVEEQRGSEIVVRVRYADSSQEDEVFLSDEDGTAVEFAASTPRAAQALAQQYIEEEYEEVRLIP